MTVLAAVPRTSSALHLPSLVFLVITLKHARHAAITDGSGKYFENNSAGSTSVLLPLCCTVVSRFTGQDVFFSLQIQGMSRVNTANGAEW